MMDSSICALATRKLAAHIGTNVVVVVARELARAATLNGPALCAVDGGMSLVLAGGHHSVLARVA